MFPLPKSPRGRGPLPLIGSASLPKRLASVSLCALAFLGTGCLERKSPPGYPRLAFSVRPGDAGGAVLRWRAEEAVRCEAYDAWSGPRPLAGEAALPECGGRFTLSCFGSRGTVSRYWTMAGPLCPAPAEPDADTAGSRLPSDAVTGLDFPSNGDGRPAARFGFSGDALPPMYPVTFVWRVNLRRQAGYYTTFFRGPDGPFTGEAYYGCHPYPYGDPKPASLDHLWELSIAREDRVDDAQGHPTRVEYGVWKLQAMRAFDDGLAKVHEFYWDLPDTTKVIRVRTPPAYGAIPPARPALIFGEAPWAVGGERLSGILRGLQLYTGALPLRAILAEAEAPRSTMAGAAGLWYLNPDPKPWDIADRSGRGHHPAWIGPGRAALWIAGTQLPE